jgi:CRP-like cAMP-binding protein
MKFKEKIICIFFFFVRLLEKKGDLDPCIFLINSGKVKVYVENEKRQKCEIKILNEGDVFGDY